MLFRRRHKKPILVSFRDIFWPSIGWGRAVLYFKHRLGRLPGTSHALAAGFACGVAVSFTPFIGLHFVLAALMAWALRVNVLTSALGTMIGNPWTFPFIWVVTFKLGGFMLGMAPAAHDEGQVHAVLSGISVADAFNRPGEVILPFVDTIFLPMLLGGLVIGFVVWWGTYYPFRQLIKEYKRKRLARLMAKYPPRLEKHFAEGLEYEKVRLPQVKQMTQGIKGQEGPYDGQR